MIRALLTLMIAGLLAACQTTVNPSESHYRASEVMRTASVDRCRVLDVRQISIGAQEASSGYGYGRALGQPEEQIGMLLGAALGGAIASQIGGGSGRVLATTIGVTGGGALGRAQGSRMAQRRMTQPGIEYSLMTSQGREMVVTQHLNAGDRIVQPGQTCRLAGSGASARVLPGDHLPTGVLRPLETRFTN